METLKREEICRLATLLMAAAGARSNEDCLTCSRAPTEPKGEVFRLPELEATRRVVGRLRKQIETATAQMDLAIEEVEILADRIGA